MNNIEYGDRLIRLGKMIKSPKTKLADLVTAAMDCGLIYSFRLEPDPEGGVEMEVSDEGDK